VSDFLSLLKVLHSVPAELEAIISANNFSHLLRYAQVGRAKYVPELMMCRWRKDSHDLQKEDVCRGKFRVQRTKSTHPCAINRTIKARPESSRDLSRDQLSILPAALQQLAMSPLFDQPAVVHHQNQVGVCDRAQPVSDDDAGTIEP
jgi:hypothetical protein